jgi:methyltransferase (TIGR00027 family)
VHEDRPSTTALLAAAARSVAAVHPITSPPLLDEVGRRLLPASLRRLVPSSGDRRGQAALRVASLGLVDQIALRTAAVDACIAEARAAGVVQFVLLGAGLDIRAYRLPALSGARVFEVDHPATQRYKQRGIRGLLPCSFPPVHVPLDLDRGGLAGALARAGHDAERSTCWVAEGLSLYLPRETTLALLDAISARSAPGSHLALTYLRTRRVVLPGLLHRAVAAAVLRLGEPLRGTFEPRELASFLEKRRFQVKEDTDARGWARRHQGAVWLPFLFRGERLVHATFSRGR